MTNAGKKALEELVAVLGRCEHDGGFDREIGPIGCMLDDKCVCVHTAPRIRSIAAYVATLEAEVEKLRASINAWCEQYDRVNIEKSTLEARATAAEVKAAELDEHNEELRRKVSDDEAASAIEDLQRQLAEKDEALREAAEALKPFAEVAKVYSFTNILDDIRLSLGHKMFIKIGDFKRAAAIVAKQENGDA